MCVLSVHLFVHSICLLSICLSIFLVSFVAVYSDQAEVRRAKTKAARQRREERLEKKRKELQDAYSRDEQPAAPKSK